MFVAMKFPSSPFYPSKVLNCESFSYSTVSPAINAIPQFLRENKSATMADPKNIPWHHAHDTTDPIFKWINDRPEVLKSFTGWMAGQRDGLPTFFNAVDFEEEFAKGADESTPVFVDVGGSMGHQCVALRQRYPNLVGRVVLQDLPETIERVKTNPLPGFEGIEVFVHDFFKPQPLRGEFVSFSCYSSPPAHDAESGISNQWYQILILMSGARVYYLRNVLHDWPDEKCISILQNLKPALTAESQILVDEMILPEKGTPWRAAQQDFIMGACVAAQERSHSEWLALFDRAGLRVERLWKYTEELSDHLISLVPK
ncbi:S-adenosyl-L-methionine-dependent methyltransferase [Xylaria venustula]|nr:S-adenosyl-L-methionine-dependent methyltransferase [Xylaria venustula]